MGWMARSCILALIVFAACTTGAMASGSTGHFDITFKGCPDTGDPALISELEAAYGDVNSLFGTCPGHVEVVVISDGAMDRIGRQVDSFSGWNPEFSAVVLRDSTVNNSSSMPVLARHELTHLAINGILSKKDSTDFHWMEEGICTLVSNEPLNDREVSGYIVGHGFLDTAGIYDAIKSEDCAVSKNGYMQSYSLVKYMEKRYGIGIIKKLLESPDKSLDAAFRSNTGEGFASFYDDWKAGVKALARSSEANKA